jgi:hypothetical protein
MAPSERNKVRAAYNKAQRQPYPIRRPSIRCAVSIGEAPRERSVGLGISNHRPTRRLSLDARVARPGIWQCNVNFSALEGYLVSGAAIVLSRPPLRSLRKLES